MHVGREDNLTGAIRKLIQNKKVQHYQQLPCCNATKRRGFLQRPGMKQAVAGRSGNFPGVQPESQALGVEFQIEMPDIQNLLVAQPAAVAARLGQQQRS